MCRSVAIIGVQIEIRPPKARYTTELSAEGTQDPLKLDTPLSCLLREHKDPLKLDTPLRCLLEEHKTPKARYTGH